MLQGHTAHFIAVEIIEHQEFIPAANNTIEASTNVGYIDFYYFHFVRVLLEMLFQFF